MVALFGGTMVWRATAPAPQTMTFNYVLTQLDQLHDQTLTSTGTWSAAQIFEHCRQSIEYSLIGFPELKPAWFQKTVGPAAFHVFKLGRRMHHPLDEEIPGAPALVQGDSQNALAELVQTLLRFQNQTHSLSPHFAFGDLNTEDYLAAHLMHIRQHLTQIIVT